MKGDREQHVELGFVLHESGNHEEGQDDVVPEVLGERQIPRNHAPVCENHFLVCEQLREDAREGNGHRDQLPLTSRSNTPPARRQTKTLAFRYKTRP